MSILKGETSVQEAPRKHGLTAAEIEDWKEKFFSGTENALRSKLGFEALAQIVAQFLVFAGHVFLGPIIFGLGAYLADLAARAVRESGVTQAGPLAVAARVSILVLAAAMALREMGFANDIILLGFGLVVGAIAIAFGVGGRHVADRKLEG